MVTTDEREIASTIGRLCTLTMPNTWRTPSASSAATIASPPVIVAIVGIVGQPVTAVC